MKPFRPIFTISSIAMLFAAGCSSSRWTAAENWYIFHNREHEALADMFYIASTNVIEHRDAQNRETYNATMTRQERDALQAEMDFMRGALGDSMHFYSPFYRQFTMNALSLEKKKYLKSRRHASRDVQRAFRHYLRHLNPDRPFCIAGFSQGGMHLIDLLKNISAKDYRRMIEAYCIGYRISEEDLRYRFVRPATGSSDLGSIVSFNSVTHPSAIWPAVAHGSAAIINPINFRTDSQEAELVFGNDTLSVHADTVLNVLVVSGKRMEDYRFLPLEKLTQKGNLHHWDILFFNRHLHRNALHRTKLYMKNAENRKSSLKKR